MFVSSDRTTCILIFVYFPLFLSSSDSSFHFYFLILVTALSFFPTVVSGRGRDMSFRGRATGLSSLCCQSSVGGMGCGGPAVGPHLVGSSCSSSTASRAGSSGSLVGVGVPSLEGEVGCPDCAALYPITDDALLHNLHSRYKRDQIYVSITSIFFLFVEFIFCQVTSCFISRTHYLSTE